MNKCITCGSKMTREVESSFHYTDCGLSKVFLKGVVNHKCTNHNCGEEEITIQNIEELHQLLAEKISSQVNKLKPEEIRYLRTHLGFSGVDFAESIGVSPETVSRWEKGTVNMKEASERFLRVLILTKLGPFRNYDNLKEYASKSSKSVSRHCFKLDHSHWTVDQAA
ncbi:MAG: helix-turn-helix domain-containing protein [Bacteriovoracaceae bacterium]|nr:helix-turn-helix domain-containing protein [Bacteriovoracaceae bacterium]